MPLLDEAGALFGNRTAARGIAVLAHAFFGRISVPTDA
jgi:hypothetical protein